MVGFEIALVDSNVVDYALKLPTKDLAVNILRFVSEKRPIVTSEYVRFEVYRGLSMSKVPDAKRLLNAFTALPVDRTIFDIAAALTTCYECDEQTKQYRASFSDGDIIIAATAFKHKLVVVTANRNDFPAPYFSEVTKHTLRDARNRPIPVYELKPDIAYLNAMLEVCFPAAANNKRLEKRDGQ